MAVRNKSRSSTSAHTKAHRTKAAKSGRSMKARPSAAVRHSLAQRAAYRSFEFFGTRYRAPLRVVGEIEKKLSDYKEEREETVGVDPFIKGVQGDLPDWAIYFKGIRQREDSTQKEMAEALGLTQSNISDIERGRRPIGKMLAKKIAERFNAEYRLLL